jgi:hypothetical protein
VVGQHNKGCTRGQPKLLVASVRLAGPRPHTHPPTPSWPSTHPRGLCKQWKQDCRQQQQQLGHGGICGAHSNTSATPSSSQGRRGPPSQQAPPCPPCPHVTM